MTEGWTAALRDRLEAAWERSDALFALVKPEALLERPIPLRQPLIFYLGHLPAFGWNQVCRGVLERPSFNADFDALFARGIDPVGVDADLEPASTAWPASPEVLRYRDGVRGALRHAFDDVAARAGRDVLAERGRVFHMVIEHELMHHETLLYMVHQLDAGLKHRPGELPPHVFGGAAPAGRVTVPAGRARLGANFDRVTFGWDNEFPEHEVEVPPLVIDRTPVRNSEFMEFVDAGGYLNPDFWTGEGWAWRERREIRHPLFWRCQGNRWYLRALFEEVPLERAGDWPVYVSWAEANAYARWKEQELPADAEFHRAAYGSADGASRPYPWGDAPPSAPHGNFGFRHWSSLPVGSHPAGASAWGVLDLVGNGWEWTRTPFGPFPGFEPYQRTYPGYSADFFDERHYVLLGASWATDVALLRRSFRNWFQPHYPYVFAKFRCVAPA